MSIEDWLTGLGEISADTQERGQGPFAQRELMFGLWLLFMDAPVDVRNAFERLDEDALATAGKQLGTALLAGRFAVPTSDGTLDDQVAYAASLLRGLEHAYVMSGGYVRAPRRAAELATSYKGVSGYVLPFAPRFRVPGKAWPPYFARRGLRMSRCLRAELCTGHNVDLVIGDPVRSPDDLHCAAILFETVEPLDSAGVPIDFVKGGKFIFHGVNLTPSAVDDAVAEIMSGEEPADIIVLPELTMPPERLKELQCALRRKSWNSDDRRAMPTLVVGGSWHRPANGGAYRNQAPVLRSNGEIIGWHGKLRPYSEEGLVEDIEPSKQILVVASPNLTVAIGICLDFCQEGEAENPYSHIDVDLVLVASMGSESTLESHDRQAERVASLRKTATFIAQQSEKEAYGFVYAKPVDGPVEERVYQRVSRRKFVTKS